MKKEEKGSLVIEAVYVFPIMLFVLLFLIYMGNMFYMRSQVDAIVSEASVKAAAYCADPFLGSVEKSGSVPRTIENIQPYHSIIGSNPQTTEVRNQMYDKLNNLGTGFFAGMGLKSIDIKQFKKETGLVSSTFVVEVSYRIKFPMRLFWDDEPVILHLNSKSTAPVTDTGEFILNVDMAMDYANSTGLIDNLKKLSEAIPFIN